MSQSFSKLLVHIIFSTKNRYPFFNDDELRSEMHRYLGYLCNSQESQVITVGGSTDHIHIFCMLSKNIALTKLLMEIKKESSIWIKTKGVKVSKFAWQKGYAAFTVAQSQCEQLVKYIQNQEEHHRKKTFQEEYREFLIRYNIKFEEKYMWD